MTEFTIKNMDDILEKAREKGPLKCAVAGTFKKNEIEASLVAEKEGIIKPVFVGDEKIIRKHSKNIKKEYVIHEDSPPKSAEKAVQLCAEDKADILLKGSVSTSSFLKPLLNKKYSMKSSSLLSHTVILDVQGRDKIIGITDGGMCISPDLREKMAILSNGVNFMKKLGIEKPKVGILSAIEKVNPKIENTLDAAIVDRAVKRGQIPDCVVDGPLAFDLMVSEEACSIKGIEGPVCGNVDLILVPNITTGNSIAKALIHLGNAEAAGAILGTKKPVVMLSRADSTRTKMNSIALGVVLA